MARHAVRERVAGHLRSVSPGGGVSELSVDRRCDEFEASKSGHLTPGFQHQNIIPIFIQEVGIFQGQLHPVYYLDNIHVRCLFHNLNPHPSTTQRLMGLPQESHGPSNRRRVSLLPTMNTTRNLSALQT